MDADLSKDALDAVREFRRLRVAYTNYLSRSLEAIGLNIPKYTAMAVLDETGRITMGVLGRRLGVTMGAVTNIVDRLVDADCATRDRGADDRRIVRVELTPKGKEMLAKASDLSAGYFGRYLSKLSVDQRKAVVASYRALADLGAAEQGNETLLSSEPG